MAPRATSLAWVEDLAEEVISPRPCAQQFPDLETRVAEHDRLVEAGSAANAAADWDGALTLFDQAYPMLFKTSTLLSALSMRLQRGEAALTAACCRLLLGGEGVLPPEERAVTEASLAQAEEMVARVFAILEAEPNAADLLVPLDRHAALCSRALGASEDGRHGDAFQAYVSAWPLQRQKPGVLVSAASSLVGDGRADLAAALCVQLIDAGVLSAAEEEAAALCLEQARRELQVRHRAAARSDSGLGGGSSAALQRARRAKAGEAPLRQAPASHASRAAPLFAARDEPAAPPEEEDPRLNPDYGRASGEEAEPARPARLSDSELFADMLRSLDRDGDGTVSKEEFRRPFMALHAKTAKAFLSEREYEATWRRIDVDGDGWLSCQELASHFGVSLGGGGGGEEMSEEARLHAEMLAEMLDDSDSDGDLWLRRPARRGVGH